MYLCKAWSASCIMHPAVSFRATGAVLHECKGIYWKFMDDSASFLQISNNFQAEKNRSQCEKRKDYEKETKVKKCLPKPSIPKYVTIFFFYLEFYCTAIRFQVSFSWAHLVNLRKCTIPNFPAFLVWVTITSAKASYLVSLLLYLPHCLSCKNNS